MLRICSLFVLLAVAAPAQASVDGAIRVIDGDTLDVGGVRVRLHGVDAPEASQTCTSADGKTWKCGAWVSREVRARYQGAHATCSPVDVDKYDRVVAVCRVRGQDMGRAIVRNGMAVAFRKYSKSYIRDEERAKRAGLGLHAGTFQRPTAFRAARQVVGSEPSGKCRIKGNISAKGTRIFHVPGQKYYDKTTIRADKGERWFCTEADARQAGWRKARQ